jgi:hypothetical protein
LLDRTGIIVVVIVMWLVLAGIVVASLRASAEEPTSLGRVA